MKSNIEEIIDLKIKEYREFEDFKTSNFSDVKSLDKFAKVKLGSILIKQMNLVIEINCLLQICDNKSFSIPEDFEKELQKFKNSISSIKIKDGKVEYSEEIEELLNKANGQNL